ncbi:hypothetical protein EV426DRAFT_703408 [Tirmania nivea]|nr:hypothetical protein EV426DRAFT_703408 [Tirmania nivea]
MEDNPEQLCDKQAAWNKDVKDEVFGSDQHITVKKICDKSNKHEEAMEGDISNAGKPH